MIMTPLLWLAASASGDHRIVDCPVPPVTMIGEVPSYVFDKHTAVGKAAIHRFARENNAVCAVLTAFVPEHRTKRSVSTTLRRPAGSAAVLGRRHSPQSFAPNRCLRNSRRCLIANVLRGRVEYHKNWRDEFGP
jgi:hypothetical protein